MNLRHLFNFQAILSFAFYGANQTKRCQPNHKKIKIKHTAVHVSSFVIYNKHTVRLFYSYPTCAIFLCLQARQVDGLGG